MQAPHGIAIHQDNLYVTDTKAHDFFKFKLEAGIRLVARLGTSLLGTQRFNSPRGLSVSTSGDVFIADYKSYRIQVLNDSLNIQRRITHETMIEPRDVKLTPDEVYVR